MNFLSIPMPSASDTSVNILYQIIGPVIDDIVGSTTTSGSLGTFADMLKTFNIYLLAFGTLIFAVMLFIGTMNSAADGQFLGRNMNSIWTPVRLVIGLLFVVPLQTGLCIGQYIFLYMILIGVTIGTAVWNEVVTDVFTTYTPPGVPVYVNNYALEMIIENVILQSIQNMSYAMGQSPNTPTTQTINDTYTVGQPMPDPVVAQIESDMAPECAALYPGLVKDCEAAVSNTLTTPNLNGTGQTIGQFDGEYYVYFGQESDPTGNFMNNRNAPWGTDPMSISGFWPGRTTRDQVQATGTVSVTFTPQTVAVASYQAQIPAAFQPDYTTALGKFTTAVNDPTQGIPAFVTKNIGTQTAAISPALVCGGTTDTCSLQPLAANLITIAQSGIATYQKVYGEGETYTDPVTGATIKGSMYYDCEGSDVTCGLQNGTHDYVIDGIPYVDQSGNITQNQVVVPLSGSWWNAGASYMILDSQFASNLQLLINFIQNNELNFVGSVKATTDLYISYSAALIEAGYYGLDNNRPGGNNWNWATPITTANPPNVNNLESISAFADQIRSDGVYQVNQESVPNVNLGDLTLGNGNIWQLATAPFNPANSNAQPFSMCNGTLPVDFSCDTNQTTEYQNYMNFYNQLAEIPPEFQIALGFVFEAAQAGGMKNCSTGIQCYGIILPYLRNLLSVMADNGFLDTNNDVLPINQAMNSIFNDMMGNAGVNNVNSGGNADGVNSIMQEIYNLGMPVNSEVDNPLSQQFSLIQQVHNVGMGAIVACMESMQTVYSHYTTIMNNFQQELAAIVYGTGPGSQQAAEILAGFGSIPIIGSIFSGPAQAIESKIQLSIAVLTLTTMSNVAIQLMWMPLFLFVMTSLFTVGIQFALLIPFMPYILFWAGSIAWVLGVLEALVAAPLVMLGIAHPGGNDYMGHAQPAVRMLLGVMFRPVLMVIGMITGIILTYVLIAYSAQGFHIVAAATFNSLPADNIMLAGCISCLLVFTYASFLVMAFTKCFSPIYMIPEKVVEWIGATAARAGEQELSQFSGNVQQMAQQGAQAGGQAMQQGIQAQEQKGQKMSEMYSKQAQTQFSVINDSAQGVSKAGDNLASFGAGMKK